MSETITKQDSNINNLNSELLGSHKKKSCENNSIDFSLYDVELKLNEISNISLFLGTGDCPKSVSFDLHDHMHQQIESLQSIVGFIRRGPSVRKDLGLDSGNNVNQSSLNH